MDKDLQIELLTSNYVKLEEKLEKHQIQIKSLEEKIEELKNLLSKIPSEQSKLSDGNDGNDGNNKLSISFVSYKKSVIVCNLYPDKNGTQNFKDEFKKLEAKWFTNKELNLKGWLFVGKLRGTLEESSKTIIEHFGKICELEYEFTHL